MEQLGYSSVQPHFQLFVIPQMCPHQALPQAPVIRDKEVQQFVDDDVVAQFTVERQQFGIEVQVAIRGTRCPFVLHRPHGESSQLSIQSRRSFQLLCLLLASFRLYYISHMIRCCFILSQLSVQVPSQHTSSI